jgi:hypothetical protein
MDEVLNFEVEYAHPLLNVPDPGGFVATARYEEPAIPREIQRVDLLHMPLEQVPDAFLLDIPNLTSQRVVPKGLPGESQPYVYSL